MIDTIEIENFQSHENCSLSLSPGVNVIKGRSHSGKSVIIRALRWALLNQPRGSHFVSHFKKKKALTSVGVEFEENYVLRERGTSVNQYRTPIDTYTALRSDVPDEVKAITQMDDINIQMQGSPYFMLDKTPGQVAKEINKLVGLDIIDETLGRLNELENKAKAKLNVLEEKVGHERQELESLYFVDDLEKRVQSVETLWTEYNRILTQKVIMEEADLKLHVLSEQIKDDDEWLTVEEPFKKISEKVAEFTALRNTHDKMSKLYDDIERAENVRQSADSLMGQLFSQLQQIKDSTEYKNQFCPKCGAHKSHWREND